jgi:2-phosphoglycerate kinase
MAKAYLIGGAPRTGKSTLARMVTNRQSMQSMATDAIRAQIRGTITQSAEPDLYYLDSLNADEANMTRLMLERTADIIAAADRESAVVWRTVETFIRNNIAAGHSIVIEGVAVLPELVATLDLDYSAVYLGNQSPEHTKVVLEYARTHPETWLGGLKPDTLAAYAFFSQATSSHIEQQARRYRQPYIEMSARPFEQSLEQALATLHADR